jgi:2-polyprenyl-3-methyl-5-hydroxy-6-metoxy-1,4-benzoquinol methylase
MITSLLTGSDNISLIERIPSQRLITSWLSELSIDIRDELHSVPEIRKYRCNDTGLMFFTPPHAAGSEWLYQQLQMIPWYYQRDRWEYGIACRELRRCRSIFEVGCGTGEFLKIARRDGHEVAGTELNSRAAAQAREAGLNVTEQPLGQLCAMNKEAFDAVCAFQVLEHVADPATFIETALKIVRPGGRMAFAVPNSAGYVGLGYDLLQNPPHHMSWWTVACFRSLSNLFPIRIERIIVEPLARINVQNYLEWYMRSARQRSPRYSWIFSQKALRVYRKCLSTVLGRLCTGHSLYAQFVKV